MSKADLRTCPFCKAATGVCIHDTETIRAYECETCLSVEKITKGASVWWYHGWQQPDSDDAPGLRRDGDGKVKPAPISFDQWVKGIETSA